MSYRITTSFQIKLFRESRTREQKCCGQCELIYSDENGLLVVRLASNDVLTTRESCPASEWLIAQPYLLVHGVRLKDTLSSGFSDRHARILQEGW